jgi:hypothetical protein
MRKHIMGLISFDETIRDALLAGGAASTPKTIATAIPADNQYALAA